MEINVTLLERTTAPLMVADKPWEDMEVCFCNVIKRDNVWHIWYSSFDHNYHHDTDGYICYAYSNDGVNWIKPNLGLIDYHGSKDNNIIINGVPIQGAFGHTVFLDEQAPPEERFKIVFQRMLSIKAFIEGTSNEWMATVWGGTSSDGIHWNLLLDKPLLKQFSDTQTVCFRDGDIYRLYVRMFDGYRMLGYTQSRTFGNFPDPVLILSSNTAEWQYYNSAATKIKDNFFVMFPSAYSPKTGLVTPHLAVSQDGIHFDRIGTGPFLDLDIGFDSKSIYVSPGCIPGDKPGTYWFYYIGYNKGHDDPHSAWKYAGGIGRFLIGDLDK